MSTINHMSTLPDAVAMQMLGFSALVDLHSAGQTSKSMHKLADHPILWKQVAKNLDVPIQPKESAKAAVKRRQPELRELNRIFTTAMNYLRQLIPTIQGLS